MANNLYFDHKDMNMRFTNSLTEFKKRIYAFNSMYFFSVDVLQHPVWFLCTHIVPYFLPLFEHSMC